MEFTKNSSLRIMFVFLLLAFALYGNVLRGEFISDDYVMIVDNLAIRNIQQIGEIFRSFNTRFLVGLSFALNYQLNALNTFGYHIVNVVLHSIVAWLVYWMTRLIFQTPVMQEDAQRSYQEWIALGAGLVFLTHPIQTQAVAFITQRAVVMGTLFYLLTIISYLKWRLEGQAVFYFWGLLALALGIFTKEMIVTVPVMLILCEVFFFPDFRKELRMRLAQIAPFFLLAAGVVFVLVLDRGGSALELKNQIAHRQFNWNYFFTEINVLRTYLRLLFWPANQAHDYAYVLSNGFWELKTVLSSIFLLGLLCFVFRKFNRRRLISFCIVWFFITTSVELFVVSFVNRGVIYEHWLYLPMAGFSIFIMVVLSLGLRNIHSIRMALIVVIVLYSVLSVQRNLIWQNEIRFWQDGVKKNPQNPMVYFALGKAYQRKSQYNQALFFYQKALEFFEKKKTPNTQLDEVYQSRVYGNLGIVYFHFGRDQQALDSFEKAMKINPQNAQAHHNLGVFYFELGEFEQASRFFKESLNLQGLYPEGYIYLAQAARGMNQEKEALSYLRMAKELSNKYRDIPHLQETERLLSIDKE